MAEARKNGWFMAIAVVSNSGQLVNFSKMDQTQFGSVKIAIHKATAAAHFRRPTKAFRMRLVAHAAAGLAVITLDGVIASEIWLREHLRNETSPGQFVSLRTRKIVARLVSATHFCLPTSTV